MNNLCPDQECSMVLCFGSHTLCKMDISFYLCDMVSLNECHTKVYAEFMKGNFVVKKSKHAFSAIAIDHTHEQNNAKVK